MAEVWLIRHAETEWSRSGQHTSFTDLPLTEDGCRVAEAIGERLRGHEFALTLSSPLQRARETARLAGLPEPQLRDDLVEWNYGEYEGRTTKEIRSEQPDWYLWTDGAPGGETPDAVAARCDRVIAELLAIDGDVAIVGHGHLMRALGARWVQEPVALGGRLYLTTGTISVLSFEREVRVIKRWNES